ncbi:MAG: acetate kinase [Lachnospiraceae bacterium]|nr:acetate kinase [Lachnospiraceae bacterium]
MKVLVINCGSSSLKYQLIDSQTEQVLAKGLCERIGIDGRLTHKPTGKDKVEKDLAMPDHTAAVGFVLDALTDPVCGVVASLKEIGAVGHRIVHGGEKFNKSVVITEDVIKDIESVSGLAPLHNPANLIGIRSCQKLMPGVPMVAVFDTAFHQTMPKQAYLYGIPHEFYEKYGIRRYGFHGTSHSYVSQVGAQLVGKPYNEAKIIVAHLGNGSSICAVKNGKSVDTSMGLTPLDGLPMGTRSGSLDPTIISYIAEKEHVSLEEVMTILNKKSGMAGMSGVGSDFRDLDAAASAGNTLADEALEVFSYNVAKFIGAYQVAVGGADAICFTAGVGENDVKVRARICKYLEGIGVKIDYDVNAVTRGTQTKISTDDSICAVWVVPTNEELAIARETVALV